MTDTRRFPAPRIVLGRKELIKNIDIIIAANFADTERSFEQDLKIWNALAARGLKLGIIHWPTFELATANIVTAIRAAVAAGHIENIVPGETVFCKTVLVLQSELLDEPPFPLPAVSTEKLYIVTEEELLPSRRNTAERSFNSTPVAVAKSDLAYSLGL